MPKLALAIALFFSLLPGNARTEEITLASYLIASPAPAQLSALSKIFGLEHKRGAQFEVIIPYSQEALLLAIAPQAELLEKNLSEANRRRLQDFRMLGEAGYHGFDQVQTWMRTHEKNHPDLLQVVDYGISRNGKPLSALRISSPESAGKPAVMITAATHGDELITTEVVMYLVDRLVEGGQGP